MNARRDVLAWIMHLFFAVQDLPEVFENSMSLWMDGFHTYLSNYSNPILDQPDGSEEAGPLERVQASVSVVGWWRR